MAIFVALLRFLFQTEDENLLGRTEVLLNYFIWFSLELLLLLSAMFYILLLKGCLPESF